MPEQAETISKFWQQESATPVHHLHAPVDSASPRVIAFTGCEGASAEEDANTSRQFCEDVLLNWMNLTNSDFHNPEGVCFISLSSDPILEASGLNKAGILSQFPRARLIVLLGSDAHRLVLRGKNKPTLEETVRAYDEFLPFFPLPHPRIANEGWLKTNPWFDQTILQILRRCAALALEKDKL